MKTFSTNRIFTNQNRLYFVTPKRNKLLVLFHKAHETIPNVIQLWKMIMLSSVSINPYIDKDVKNDVTGVVGRGLPKFTDKK